MAPNTIESRGKKKHICGGGPWPEYSRESGQIGVTSLAAISIDFKRNRLDIRHSRMSNGERRNNT